MTESTPHEALGLLAFWFGPDLDAPIDEARGKLWFDKNPETDALLASRFGALCEEARAGGLTSWKATPRGRLALVILIDQLSRNIHRGKPEAFSADSRALALALEGIDQGEDAALSPIERSFLYMPLMHAEDKAIQERSVELFEELARTGPDPLRPWFDNALRYAIAHRDIVQRFGRFPHRNSILQRTSTADEMDFLTQPGSSF